MNRSRRHPPGRRGTVWLAAVVCVAACTAPGGGDPEDPPPEVEQDGGDADGAGDEVTAACEAAHDAVVRWVTDEPFDELLAPAVGDRRLVSWLRHGLHQGLHARTSDGDLVPDLLASEGRLEPGPDGTVVVHLELREDLRFSDGTPLTGETVRETYELLADPEVARALGDVAGYDRIVPDGWTVDGQRFSFTLDGPSAGWRRLFSRVLPTHVLPDVEAAAAAFATLTVDGAPLPVSGAYVPTSWRPGERLVLERDPDHHGANPDRRDLANHGPACVGTLELTARDDPDAVARALEEDAADLAVAPAAAATASLPSERFPRSVPVDGPVTQVVVDPTGPHLADVLVREALATVVDRQQLVDEVHAPLLGAAAPAGPVGTALLPPEPSRDLVGEAGLGRGDLDAATLQLERAGYLLDASGVWQHPERGTLTVTLEVVADDPVRTQEGRLLERWLADHGWEVAVRERPLADVLDRWLPGVGEAPDAAPDPDPAGIAVLALETAPDPVPEAERYRAAAGPLGAAGLETLLDRCAGDPEPERCYLRLERALVTADGELPAMTAVPLALRPYVVVHAAAAVARVPDLSVAADAGPLAVAADLLSAG